MKAPLRPSLSVVLTVLGCLSARSGLALNRTKSLTQYTRTIWTQEQGLPQDTIRAIAQTTDGYLWLGTDEGLARFDGYEFVIFNKDHGDLPSNSITALEDQCAHRSAPLSRGRLIGDEIACPYHGFRYNAAGACTHVPIS